MHVAGSAGNSSQCTLCKHREQQTWGSVKTVQPREGAPPKPEKHMKRVQNMLYIG